MTSTQIERARRRDDRLDSWARDNDIDIERLDQGQRWLTFAALRIGDAIGPIRPLRRALTFFLTKADMGLSEEVIGTIVGVSDRSVRTIKAKEPKALLDSVAQTVRGHAQPKLRAEHAGVVARLLIEHPKAEAPELIRQLEAELGITIERHTLARYLERYGLGCLREHTVEEPPLFGDTPPTAALSS